MSSRVRRLVAVCPPKVRRRALVVLLLSVAAACSSGEEAEPQSVQPEEETLEMPTYRATLPEGWQIAMDDDPSDQDGAGFRSDDEYRVHGGISRNPIDQEFAASAHDRITGIVEGHRGTSNLLEIAEAEPLGFDIDGAEAWRTEARFGSDVESFRTLWVAFQHDGQDYVVTFEGSEPLAESDRAAFEELLRSWEWH